MEEKDYKIVIGIFDTISKAVRDGISSNSKGDKPLGVGIYTDEYCKEHLFTTPMKPLEHRMEIAQGFSGVAFTFPVDNMHQADIEKAADEAYKAYMEEQQKAEKSKKYKVGFLIGSFDLFHAGHLENICMAKEMCEHLYVVVKTDERIFDRKNKYPIQNTTERAEILKALDPVEGVTFYDIDSTRSDVINDIIERFNADFPGQTLEESEMVAIFGEDLKEKEEQRKADGDWGEVSVVITPRPKEKMRTVSSSAYQRKIKEQGGLVSAEMSEARGLQTEVGGLEFE